MDEVLCKWELATFPANEFEYRDGIRVHHGAGLPLHTAAGRLYERGTHGLAGRRVSLPPDGDGGS